ncbi:hypothetical protein L226DRAFT_535635 [Lentinus tigrinus ALCF2SS1-7]|uniref:Auxin efflux carrier n=1 Tax=Lentinus tigrinus ALCF2SS1-6 TaxID=1328759 RepID=A0A5C2RVG0_9APHY|nr:hypothetical protein L227DRAFT_580139 [Lentinus tigrinus ALCF2SS1-6]RPD74165.1 hypothetical protein L226DRAFT_535635 [Lentinus tigrinus ALCF2SS1-7]
MAVTPIGPLLKTTFESILEVFLICFAGYILARKGVLDRATQKKLNRLNVSIFTPSLLFSKVAFFLSPAKLRELWIIPIFFVLTTVVSAIVAYIFGSLMRLKKSQRSFAIASSMFMNSNSLPIALMQSLVVTVPGLKWEDDDNNDAMVGRALTYLVLYSTLGMVVRWSYGVRLLSQADPESIETEAEVAEAGEASPLVSPGEVPFPPSAAEEQLLRHQNVSTPSIASEDSQTVTQGKLNPNVSVEEVSGRKFFYSFPNTPSTRTTLLPQASSSGTTTEYEDDEEDDDEEDLPAGRRTRTEPSTSKFQSRVRRLKHRVHKFWKGFREFMTVPLWAAIASLIVACIRPLQHALEEHLPPVKNAIASAGDCSIPITLVVLGAYFYTPPDPEEKARRGRDERLPEHSRQQVARSASRASLFDSVREMFSMKSMKGKGSARALGASAAKEARPGETKTVVVAIMSRMIITPLVLLPLMVLSTKYDLQKVFDDPVFVVSNVLLIASPPALTLAQITQAASGDAFERLISRTIFWSYCAVTPPSTIIFVVIGLILSKL